MPVTYRKVKFKQNQISKLLLSRKRKKQYHNLHNFCLNVLPSCAWQRVQYIYTRLSWQNQIRMTFNPVVLSPKAYTKKLLTSEELKLKHVHHNMYLLYGQWGHYIKLVNLIYMSWWVKMEASDACWSIGASYTRQDFYDTKDFIGKLIGNTFVNLTATIQFVCDI